MKKFLKVLLIIVLAVIVAVAALFGWLTATEYKPAAVEAVDILRAGDNDIVRPENSLNILSWNVGYGGLGKDSDSFMDGGKDVTSADKETTLKYLDGIEKAIAALEPDILMLQEVDEDCSRTYGINELDKLWLTCRAYAPNYVCKFVPFPLPPIGRVNTGVMTTTDDLYIDAAQRIALPCPFEWPVRTANLKRCLLASWLPIEGSDSQLVIVNLHLEAYDSGEGKIAQTKQLMEFITSEYEKGNYVIAGGDFNQVFPGSLEVYPNLHPENWEPGTLEADILPEGWQFAYDLSVPSCRLLNQPYDPEDTENTQYYVIDGFILSPNVELNSVNGIDERFENSDHNPVLINVSLK